MKSGSLSAWLLLAFLAVGAPAQAQPLPVDALALHWHPATADRARNRTLAAAAWLERGGEPTDWTQAVDALELRLQSSLERTGPIRVSLIDGMMAWLVGQRRVNLGQSGEGFPEPDLTGIEGLLESDHSAGELARLRVVAAYRADAIWDRVAEALGDRPESALVDYWQPLLGEPVPAAGSSDAAMDHARAQARRVRALASADPGLASARLRDEVLRAEAVQAWETGRLLDAVWIAFEALSRLTQLEEPASEPAARWAAWLETIESEQGDELRLIDVDLPVVLALLGDAAGYLASPGQAMQSATAELADTYSRLVLFAPDLAFYFDQPVREGVRSAIASCNPDPLLVGPLPREVFERCARSLEDLLANELDSEELVGGGQGPFANEFLRRELGLVSWQRAAYLDGHLDWLLATQCQPPQWVNTLEWSLVANHLVRWVSQRPVFFTGSGWRTVLDRLAVRMRDQADAHVEWVDCLTGRGSRRLDPIMRLLALHRQALDEVSALLQSARAAFYDDHTRPGADIELDGSSDQVTAYRPQDLGVGPCPEARTCGARVELPASRALLGLFPNSFLLADQVGMGELDVCYDEVRWVDREREPARRRASRVADYRGRLSFDLVGTFRRADGDATVFRYRLTDSEMRHYLFAADDESIQAEDCPIDRVGSSVASNLAEDHPGLVPNRLTYFTSAPTTPEALLLANWDQGAEWRDWFVTGRRVNEIEAADPAEMEVAVQAELADLVGRRERQLTAPMINPPRSGDEDPVVMAMARVADTAALLRRVLELHYPRIVRQHAPVRALVAGEAGLITRDRIRLLRESGVPASRMPGLGLERVERFRNAWSSLPEALRERGQRPPEIDYSLERLSELQRRINR